MIFDLRGARFGDVLLAAPAMREGDIVVTRSDHCTLRSLPVIWLRQMPHTDDQVHRLAAEAGEHLTDYWLRVTGRTPVRHSMQIETRKAPEDIVIAPCIKHGKHWGYWHALNDVLIKDEINSRLVHLEVFADGELVTGYTCDGLIFSTPTGSTAYNLSAGGPLIHPDAAVIAMTPICPHTLSNRAIIFREGVQLRIFNRTGNSRLLVAMDGQRNLKVGLDSPVDISIAKHRLALAQSPDYSHFSVVRAKLKWSGALGERQHSHH